jgi:hypothetical protein
MLEPGDQAQIDRLERRVYQMERANWKHADFAFRVTMYGFSVAIIVLAVVSIVLSASHPGH